MRQHTNHSKTYHCNPVRRKTVFTESWECQPYAIILDDSVAADALYMEKNPRYVPGMPHIYIGMSCLTPAERFQQHITGHRNASKIAHRYGRELFMGVIPPNTKPTRRKWAMAHERKLARELRAQGYGVWQA